ncbi:MAG: tRNA pseudouridine(55) synthase TruB [Myxococcota bacterium]
MNGVVVVDKPSGCTSHDVVQRVRRAIQQRSVGHAGTLDPLATGVLVVAVGEATKLASFLQAQDKRYDATIALGTTTDSLDADGTVTGTCDVPVFDEAEVNRALEPFLGSHPQRVPEVSAIKVDGTPLYRRARRGESVEAPFRQVELFSADVQTVSPSEISLSLHCSKGFYVRSLARDLAEALGTAGHIKKLRRTASGHFDLTRAVPGDGMTRDAIEARLVSLAEACDALPKATLDAEGAQHARHGRAIPPENILDDLWRDAGPEVSFALFGIDGQPIAIGRRQGDGLRVVRGFVRDA